MLGKVFLYEKDLKKAKSYFKKSKNYLMLSYCLLMEGKAFRAELILKFIKEESPAAKWLYFLSRLVQDKNSENPTYFQIRNFFEQDLEMLFFYNQNKFIDKVLLNTESLSNFNREVYKYCARVFLNNGFYDKAEEYLKTSLDICYKDPETHFLNGELYIKKKMYDKAALSFNKAIEVNSGYCPAKIQLQILNNIS
ncbi:MAG: hypothetical protein LUG16_00080 [Candidatus Gastranaerophilales bacterium]|nr:hypothetical protein [Candidatus Gastranaerophilales bacterium]